MGTGDNKFLRFHNKFLRFHNKFLRFLNRFNNFLNNLFVQPATIPDLGTIKDEVQELYGLGLRKISRPEFFKPYP